MNIYISFGQSHTHRVNGYTLDKDCIAVIKCNDYNHGRELAFDFFGDKFSMSYTEDEIVPKMHYFPRGFIYLN